jgi:DNA-binding MarR family transcriptional regulator
MGSFRKIVLLISGIDYQRCALLGTYQAWGFRSPPFEPGPLPPTDEGAKLLIGREEELIQITRRLLTRGKILTVEGSNGIGKTSINNVAAFTAFRSFLQGEVDQLLVPCEKTFQLVKDSNIEAFIENVFLQIGLTLVKHTQTLRESGRGSQLDGPIAAWLTSPTFNSVRANLSIHGLGAGGGASTTANTSAGFSRAGYYNLIKTWLNEIFPNGEGGGIVCSIDNLELLRESEAARQAFEVLRDEILTVPGLRWILCGSLGIVRSLASTPRLNGYLHTPIEIGDIEESVAGSILESRVETFKNGDKPYLPMIASDFTLLYQILRGNIRDTLSEADNFCNWVADGELEHNEDSKKHEQFMQWLKQACSDRLEAARPYVSARPWKLFSEISKNNGQCSPGAFTDFGFATQQAMRSQVISLENARLVISVRNEDDNRRKTIYITPAGWMVDYALRSGIGTLFFNESEGIEADNIGAGTELSN